MNPTEYLTGTSLKVPPTFLSKWPSLHCRRWSWWWYTYGFEFLRRSKEASTWSISHVKNFAGTGVRKTNSDIVRNTRIFMSLNDHNDDCRCNTILYKPHHVIFLSRSQPFVSCFRGRDRRSSMWNPIIRELETSALQEYSVRCYYGYYVNPEKNFLPLICFILFSVFSLI